MGHDSSYPGPGQSGSPPVWHKLRNSVPPITLSAGIGFQRRGGREKVAMASRLVCCFGTDPRLLISWWLSVFWIGSWMCPYYTHLLHVPTSACLERVSHWPGDESHLDCYAQGGLLFQLLGKSESFKSIYVPTCVIEGQ